ncbi:MAG: hydrogenase iron-sulfur subunit [bacterium]|nr:hydrogenase iron-sulfur subunit [bacterium]
MDSAVGSRGHELRITIFHCPRCCGETAAAAGHGCRVVDCCGAEVDGTRVAAAFLDGADGVLVLGCLGRACQRSCDDVEAFRRIHAGALALQRLGVAPARLQRHWLTPREATRIPALLVAFRRRLHVLGPRPRQPAPTTPEAMTATGP